MEPERRGHLGEPDENPAHDEIRADTAGTGSRAPLKIRGFLRSMLAATGVALAACAGCAGGPQLKDTAAEQDPRAEKIEQFRAALKKYKESIEGLTRVCTNFEAEDTTDFEKAMQGVEGVARLRDELRSAWNVFQRIATSAYVQEGQNSPFVAEIDRFSQDPPDIVAYVEALQRFANEMDKIYHRYVRELNDANFSTEVGTGEVYLVMVSADWCLHCFDAMPNFARLAKKAYGRFKVGRAKVQGKKRGQVINPQIEELLNKDRLVLGFPAFIVFIDGKSVIARPNSADLGSVESLETFVDEVVESYRRNDPEDHYEPGGRGVGDDGDDGGDDDGPDDGGGDGPVYISPEDMGV